MPDGLRDLWSLEEPQSASSTQEAEVFKQAFQQRLNEINAALQYTAAHADATSHAEQAAKRDKLIAVYQAVLGRFGSSDANAAKAAADKALSAAQGTAAGVDKFHAESQQCYESWQQKQAGYDQLLAQIDQMEQYGDPKADALRSVLTKIQQEADKKQYKGAVQAVDQVAEKIKPLYEKAQKNYELKQEYEQRLQALEPQLSQASQAPEGAAGLQQEVLNTQGQMQQAAASQDYEAAMKHMVGLETKVAEFSTAYSQETTKSGDVTRTAAVGEAAGAAKAGANYDPVTGEATMGVEVRGHATGYHVHKEGGPVSGDVRVGHIEGQAKAGYLNDPTTGASFAGAKASGKAALGEVTADTPLGKFEGAVGKVEAEGLAGYEYDPESQVTFAGVKGKASAAVFEGKLEGKYGKLEAKALSAGVESKTGVEYDEKTGKLFVGTTNKAEASVLEGSATLKTADDSVKLVGEAQVLKAEASLDANAVVDEYGIDISGKAGAEANIYKVGVGGEVRMTPKALFDNTVGAIVDMEAPDFLDFGPVVGAKVSEGKGVGGTVEGGMRLGVDEVNVRGGGFIELAEGVGLDVKTGVRLGPLKYAVDNWDEIEEGVSDAGEWLSEKAAEAEKWAEEQKKKGDEAVEWADEQIEKADRWLDEQGEKLDQWVDKKSDEAEKWADEQVGKADEWVDEQADKAEKWADEQIDSATDWAEQKAREAAEAKEAAEQDIADAAERVSQKAGEAVHWGSKQLDAAQDWASERASEVSQWASEKASEVQSWAEEKSDQAQSWANEQIDSAKEAATEAATQVTETASDAKNWLEEQASSTWDSIFG